MKKPAHNPILDAIDRVFNGSSKGQLKLKNLQLLNPELRALAQYLKVTQNEAFFFALIATDNFAGNSPDISDFCRHLDASPMMVMKFLSDIDGLIKKGLVSSKPGRRNSELISDRSHTINSEITFAILHRLPMPVLPKRKIYTTIDALSDIYELVVQRIDLEVSHFAFLEELPLKTKQLERFPLIAHMQKQNLDHVENSVLYYVLWKSILGNKSVDIENLIRTLQGKGAAAANFFQSLQTGKNPLISKELLEMREGRFLNEIELGLTDKCVNQLLEFDINVRRESVRKKNVIAPDNIVSKQLFYNAFEKEQLNSIFSTLKEENYQQLKDRLWQLRLPLSMNILLYGAPGTGKTASVFQLAKQTGREILKVDISQTKSMWFGESEKIIKRVFTEYASYSESIDKTPILLFNEADAILGTRNSLSSSNARQTENTIQNILLEELENFKGIFIATTNLVNNLDSAFERRFLFKVKLEHPHFESRILIWKEKMPQLSEAEAKELSSKFNFSGGQIENIVRKCQINFIVKGLPTVFNQILTFCEQETISAQRHQQKIGFYSN